MMYGVIEDQWPYILSLVPEDYEETAKLTGALTRRRVIRSASDLLRLAMDYALCTNSLRETSCWATSNGLKMSNVAVLKRLRRCDEWLSILVTQKLEERLSLPETGRLRVRVVDATSICRRGSKGSDWRLHLSFDLGRMCLDDLHLTTYKKGETLSNFDFAAGDVVIGDRAYGERKGIGHVMSCGGDVVVRVNWHNLPLLNLDGTHFNIIESAKSVGEAKSKQWSVMTAPCSSVGSIRGRLVVLRKSPQAAEIERRRLCREYRRKGRTPDERTLVASDFIFVFTTLSSEQASSDAVMELYRFRWQIELAIKRLKSLLFIDEMNALSDDLCRTFLLAKLFAALLVEDLAERADAFSPWGYGRPASSVTDKDIPDAGWNAVCGSGDNNHSALALSGRADC